MARSSGRPQSATTSSRRSRVSTCRRSQSGASQAAVSNGSAGSPPSCQEPKSSSARSAISSVDTTPRPLDVRSMRRSCTQTRMPSRGSRTSHSRPSAPSSMARRYAANVCSASSADAPRCATTSGALLTRHMLARDRQRLRAYPDHGGSRHPCRKEGVSPIPGGSMAGASRVATVGLLALAPLLPLAAPAGADVFVQAQTTATAVHVSVTQQPAGSIITASLFDDAVAYAAGDYDSGGSSEALAAPAFPGRLVVQGPQLLCSEVFDCPVSPPSYPLLADASYPRRPHDRAAASGQPIGSGPFVVTPLAAGATAGAAGNTGAATGAATSLLTGTPGAVTAGASSASSTVTGTAGGLHLRVASTVTDVSIAGLVHIATVAAPDDNVVAPRKRPGDTPPIPGTRGTLAGPAAPIHHPGGPLLGHHRPSPRRP